jgi:hypothetical protein
MATTIKLKNGSGAPLAGDLVQGEPAFDLTNKRLYTEDSGGTVIEVGTNPSTLTVDTDTLAVDATNNRVGIGTTSPTSTASAGPTLEISGTAGGNLVLSDSNATSGQRAKYLLSQGGALYVGHSADNGTSPVNDLVINASGNVGIGTSSPSFILGTGLHIDSSGYTSIVLQKGGAGQGHNIDFTDASNALQYRIGTNFASGGENLLFAYGSTPTIGMTLNASGNVGIGTTSPNGKLDITGSGNTDIYLNTGNNSGDNNRLFFGDTADIDVGYLSYDHGTNTMSFGVNAAERMRIDSSGNVLIGNTAQIGTEKLSVNINSGGTAYNTSSMQSSALAWLNNAENDLTKASTLVLRQFNAASAISGLYTGTQNAALTFGTSSSGSSGNVVESMRIDSSGNVGIGTASPVVSSGYNSLTINDTTSGYLVLQNNGTTKMEAYVSGGTEATLRGTGVPLAFVTTAAHEMTFDTNATERMRIDSSGNVGIGVAPVAGYGKKLQVHSAAGGGASVHITDSVTGSTASDGLELITFNSAAYIWNREASFMSFGTSATERMRIDSSGNLLVGKTTTALTTAGVALLPNGELYVTRDSGATAYFNREGSDGDVIVIRNDNVTVGSISVSGSTTSYNPSSDVRLKENIRDYDNALADVMKLKPRKYSWKTDGAEDSGFIAQELMETPEFANRVNPIDDDSDDPMYGVDYMKFVAVLTGAIQEQQAMIEDLKAEVAALKGA